jgi:hypothetical protein
LKGTENVIAVNPLSSLRSRVLALASALLALSPLPALAQTAGAAPVASAASAAAAVKAVVAPAAPAAAAPASAANPAAAVPAGALPAPAPAAGGLDQRVQELKGDVLRLNRDLLVLEEELLYPAGSQVAVFISTDVGKLFELESVQIRLDDKVVVTHLYTAAQVQALHRGGVQRIWVGNLKAGTHRVDAFFTGRGPYERDYKRGASLSFEKAGQPKYIELRIRDTTPRLQPEFEVKVWQ